MVGAKRGSIFSSDMHLYPFNQYEEIKGIFYHYTPLLMKSKESAIKKESTKKRICKVFAERNDCSRLRKEKANRSE